MGLVATHRRRGRTRAAWCSRTRQRDAVLAALSINVFARHADRVRMANIAQMINVLQAMILTDKDKMVLTPTYHAFQMYVPFQGATAIPVDIASPQLDSGGSRLPGSGCQRGGYERRYFRCPRKY